MYKHWWHGTESILNANSIPGGSSYNPLVYENKSSVMNGFGAGLEVMHDFSRKNFDCNLYYNISLTFFQEKSYVASVNNVCYISNYKALTYPYNETKGWAYFNITAGFKFGYRKEVKTKK